MTSSEGVYTKLVRQKERHIGVVGEYEVVATTYLLELALQPDKALAHVKHQSLMPRRVNEYVAVSVAAKETGLTARVLRKLAKDNQIEAVRIGRRWMVLLPSVQKYLRETAMGEARG